MGHLEKTEKMGHKGHLDLLAKVSMESTHENIKGPLIPNMIFDINTITVIP
jgi:hypothetical protein